MHCTQSQKERCWARYIHKLRAAPNIFLSVQYRRNLLTSSWRLFSLSMVAARLSGYNSSTSIMSSVTRGDCANLTWARVSVIEHRTVLLGTSYPILIVFSFPAVDGLRSAQIGNRAAITSALNMILTHGSIHLDSLWCEALSMYMIRGCFPSPFSWPCGHIPRQEVQAVMEPSVLIYSALIFPNMCERSKILHRRDSQVQYYSYEFGISQGINVNKCRDRHPHGGCK